MQTNNALRLTILSGLFLVPFIPFIVAGSFFFPFITGKGFAFRILIELLAGLWIMLALRDSSYRPTFSLLTYAFVTFVVVVGIADLFGMNPIRSFWSNYERMEGLVTLLHLLAYFMVLGAVFTKEILWERFFKTTLAASFLMTLYGFAQHFHFIGIDQGSTRLDATLGNATYFAVYLLFHIFLAALLLFREWGKVPMRYVYGLLILLETVVLYYTATRGAILGLLGGVLLTGMLIALFSKEHQKLKKAAFVTVGVVVILVGLFFAVKHTSFVTNSPVLSRFSSISLDERTTKSRFLIWNMAWQGVTESPKTFFIGWGQENFNYVFNKYYDANMYDQEPWFDRTHNVFFDWLVAGGIFGLAAYLSLFGLGLYLLWKRSGLPLPERAILTGMLVAYFFHNLFVFDQLVSYVFFATFLAYIHARSLPVGNQIKAKELSAPLSLSLQGVAVLVTIVLVYVVNVPGIKANLTLISALVPHSQTSFSENIDLFKQALAYGTFGNQEIREQIVQASASIRSANVPIEEKQKLFDLAASEMGNQIKETPNDARHYLFLGSLFDAYGLSTQAIPILEKAHELSPQKQTILFELASAYVVLKQYDKALAALKTAYTLAPEYREAQILYAAGAVYAGQDALVEEMVKKLGGSTDPRILKAYQDIGRFDKAIALWNEVIKNDPSNAQSHLSLAGIYFQAGRKAESIAEIRKVIELQPSFKDEGQYYIDQIQSGKNP